MIRGREMNDVLNELALYKKLASLQDKLLAAYRLHRHPGEATLDGLEKVRKALDPYRQLDVLR